MMTLIIAYFNVVKGNLRKHVQEIQGELNVNNPIAGLTTEELREIVAMEKDQNGTKKR